MFKIDVISDVHWDLWVSVQDPEYSQAKKFNFLLDKIIPKDHSDILVIAGDIGHYNDQNAFVFSLLRERYKYVVYVSGNHDLYLVSKSVQQKYFYDSFKRLNEMAKISQDIPGVFYLDGNIVELDGIKIGGCSMWYDYSYGITKLGFTIQYLEEVWEHRMNDSRLIKVYETAHGAINNLEHFQKEYAKMEKIYKDCDVVVSHIGPNDELVPPHYRDAMTSFYYFDGSKLLDNMTHNQVWIYGHTHDPYDYVSNTGGTRLFCNPLGYPLANNWMQVEFSQRVKTITLNK